MIIIGTTCRLTHLRIRNQPFLALVVDRQLKHFFRGFTHDDTVITDQRNEGIRAMFDILDQVGVEDKGLTVEACKFNHRWELAGWKDGCSSVACESVQRSARPIFDSCPPEIGTKWT